MEVEKTLRPGADGTAKYMHRFGKRLVCVRHRIDREAQKRYTTVELILDERPCVKRGQRTVPVGTYDLCRVRIEAHEHALQKLARANNGRWDRASQTWLLRAWDVEHCCLWDRVVGTEPRGKA